MSSSRPDEAVPEGVSPGTGARRDARRWRALVLGALLGALWVTNAWPARAQTVQFVKRDHLTVGGTLGIYPLGGGFDLADQGFDYQGVHIDAVRLGFSQLVSRRFRMELAGIFGLSLLADPGYVPNEESGESGANRLGFHWGFGLSGYYRFPVGLTLGVGGEITFGFGEFLDTTFFRLLPAIGWELSDPVGESFVHLRWVTGITLLAGLEELNEAPRSNLTMTGLQAVYGF